MKSPRSNSFVDNFQSWMAQVLISILRGIFQLSEFFVSEDRRIKLVTARKKMESIEQARDLLLQQIDKNPREGMDHVANFFNRYGDYDTRQNFNELHRQLQAGRAESDALQTICKQAGDDTVAAIAGYKKFIAANPKSHSAYSYIGGSLAKIKDWDASREAERLSGDNLVSASIARLSIGNVLHQKGKVKAAIAQYRRMIDAVPPEHETIIPSVYILLGNLLNEQGNRSEARSLWKEVVKRNPYKLYTDKARKLLKENP